MNKHLYQSKIAIDELAQQVVLRNAAEEKHIRSLADTIAKKDLERIKKMTPEEHRHIDIHLKISNEIAIKSARREHRFRESEEGRSCTDKIENASRVFLNELFLAATKACVEYVIICRGSAGRQQQQTPKLLEGIDKPYLVLNIDSHSFSSHVENDEIFYMKAELKPGTPLFTTFAEQANKLISETNSKIVFIDFTSPKGYLNFDSELICHPKFRYVQAYFLTCPALLIKPHFFQLTKSKVGAILYTSFHKDGFEYSNILLSDDRCTVKRIDTIYDIEELESTLADDNVLLPASLINYISYAKSIDDLTIEQLFSKSDNVTENTVRIRKTLVDKQWQDAARSIEKNPEVINHIPHGSPLVCPTLIFLLAKHADDTPECLALTKTILENTDWTITNKPFNESPFFYALGQRKSSLLKMMTDFLVSKPSLHSIFVQKPNGHAYFLPDPDIEALEKKMGTYQFEPSDTPLITAIKNGCVYAAIIIASHCSRADLMRYGSFSNTALQLASYLRINKVIHSILSRAKTVGCLTEISNQTTLTRFTAAELYEHGYQPPTHLGQRFFSPVIKNVSQSLCIHKFNYEQDSDKDIDPALLLMMK